MTDKVILEKIEQLENKIKNLNDLFISERKANLDRIQELREMREADTITSWFREIRENIDNYREEMLKIKKGIEGIWNMEADSDNIDLSELREKSGTTLKELAIYLDMDHINLSSISRLISGKVNDKIRMMRAKNYMLKQLSKKAKLI